MGGGGAQDLDLGEEGGKGKEKGDRHSVSSRNGFSSIDKMGREKKGNSTAHEKKSGPTFGRSGEEI